jgi:hypothetical protein
MPLKPIAGACAAFAVAALLWLLARAPEAPPAPVADAGAGGRSAAAAAPNAASGLAANAHADPANEPAATRAAVAAASDAATRPLPDDAQWVELVVVDGASGAPVADAEVHWTDERSLTLLREAVPDDQWLAMPQLPIEALAARAGWRTRSDAQGRARVTLRTATRIAAQRGGRYGTLQLAGNTVLPPAGLRLPLQPDATLAVRVLDAVGAPAADVPVGIMTRNADDLPVGRYSLQVHARTGPDGMAAIPHVQLIAAEFVDGKQLTAWNKPPFTHCVRSCLPGLDGARAPIDLAAPPPQVELRLPAHGSVRVRTAFAGAPIPGVRTAWLAEPPEAAAAPASDHDRQLRNMANRPAVFDADGRARFAFVPLGRRWHVTTPDVGGLLAVVDGPMAHGQEVEATLAPDPARCVLRGRLFAAVGEPLRQATVRVFLRDEDPRGREATVATDGGGRFLAAIEPLADSDATATLAIDWQSEGAPLRRATLPERRLLAGLSDLGDVVLGEPPRLVSGRIERDGAPFAGPCAFEVQREPAPATPSPEPTPMPDVVGHVAPDGRFVVHGTFEPGAHSLVVRASDGTTSRPVRFQGGADGVVVALAGAHPLAARALLPDGAPAHFVAFELAALDPPPAESSGGPQRHRAEVRAKDGVDVRWTNVPTGRYELTARVLAQTTPALTIPDVLVPGPAEGDARLRELDLRRALRVLTLTLRDANGERLASADGLLVPTRAFAAAGGDERSAERIWSGEQSFALPPGPYDLTVCVAGYRPQPLRGDADRAEARLEPWPQAEVQLAAPPQLPAGCAAEVRLVATAADGAPFATSHGPAGLGGIARLADMWTPLVAGVARVRIGDGPHAVELALRGPNAPEGTFARVHLDGARPATIAWTGEPVVVTVPAAAWQAAIAAVTKSATGAGGDK